MMTLQAINLEQITHFGLDMFSGEMLMSYLAMIIVLIVCVIINIRFKHADPAKAETSGFDAIVVLAVEQLDGMVRTLMGKKYQKFGGYAFGLIFYIGVCFIIGVTGLPAPFTYLGVTLSLSLCTFIMIHATAARANKWGYFHRYIEPFAFFLPINLMSMWAPFLSLGLRLFGNALAGYTLLSIVYYFLGIASHAIFGGIIPGGASYILIAPIVTPVLHAYFDMFSGMIQTLIFTMLTMIFISQEDPDEDEE